MDIKKSALGIWAGLIAAVFALPLASAQLFGAYDIRYGIEQGIDIFINFFRPFFEAILGDYSGSEFFWAKVLLLLLIFVIVRLVVLKVPLFDDKPGVANIIAVVVSVLGVRYIQEDSIISGVLIPYGTLAIAISVLLPFILFFFFVEKSGMTSTGKRVLWIIFGAILSIFWLYRSPGFDPIANQIYLWTIVAVVLIIVFEKKINEFLEEQRQKRAERNRITGQIIAVEEELEKAGKSNLSDPNIKNYIKDLESNLERLRKHRARI